MKKHILIFCVLTVFIASNAVSVDACWCRKDPEETNTDEKFKKTVSRLVSVSDFVFAGTLVEENNTQLIFKVENVWKGDFKDSITFYFPHNVTDDKEFEYFIDSCQFNFELGKSYLVYANATINGLSVSKCGRTNFLDKSQRDIDELNKQKAQMFNFSSEFIFSKLIRK